MAEKFSGAFAIALSAVAVCVSTLQAWISWDGRNSHIALNLHSEQMRACASVAGRIPRLLNGVSALAQREAAMIAWGSEQAISQQRQDAGRIRGEIMEQLEIISMISDDTLSSQATKLALNVQNLVNNATGLKDLDSQVFKDLRDGVAVEASTFIGTCRERLRPQGT